MNNTWRKFTLEGAEFSSEERKADYMENCRCGVCHQKLEEGDEWDFRAITNNPGFTQQAVIVHRKCVHDE